MKRISAILLAFVFIFSFCACKKSSETLSDVESGAGIQVQSGTEDFVKPESYASVVVVTINPQFKLYLDVEANVLAVEPVNDDAKSVIKNISVQKGDIETVVGELATVTADSGFVKENATVNFEVVEIKNEHVNTDSILSKVKESADKSFKEINIAVEINVSVSEDAKVEKVEDTSSQSSSSDTSSSTSAPSSATSSSAPVHTHSYAAATCTAPQTCSCGATSGEALGHQYNDGVCSRCGTKDPNFKYTSVKEMNGTWDINFLNGETLSSVSFAFIGELGYSVGFGDPFSKLPEDFQEEIREDGQGYVVFEGNEYYIGRGDGDMLASVTENGNTVTVTDGNGKAMTLERIAANQLKITVVSTDFGYNMGIPAGAVLNFTATVG